MRKYIALFLSLCLLASLFTGCVPAYVMQEILSELDEATASIESEPTEEWSNHFGDTYDGREPTDEETIPLSSNHIPETVIFDTDGIRITANGENMRQEWGYQITFTVENNSDRTISYSCDHVIINGICVDGFVYCDVAPGKTAIETMDFYDIGLLQYSITDIAIIESRGATIWDTNTYEELYSADFTLQGSIAADEQYQQVIDAYGEVLVNQDNIMVIELGIVTYFHEYYGYRFARMMMQNATGSDLAVEAVDVSVNGIMLDTFSYETIWNDSTLYFDIVFYDEDLENAGIEKIENVTFCLEFTSLKTYETLLKTEEFEINKNYYEE